MDYLLSIWSWTGDNAATIIALCALFFTAWQISVTRRHNKLSVQPHIATFTLITDEGEGEDTRAIVNIVLSNNGLGPAIIRNFEYSFDGEKIKFNDTSEANKYMSKFAQGTCSIKQCSILKKMYVLPVGYEIVLVELAFPMTKNVSNEINEFLDRVDISVEHESIYGDNFTYTKQKHA